MSLTSFMKHGEKRKMRKSAGPTKGKSRKKTFPLRNSEGKFSKTQPTTNARSAQKTNKPTATKLLKLKRPPTDTNDIRKLMKEFIQWALKPDNFIAEDFPIDKGISPFKFRRLHLKDDQAAESYWHAMAVLGSKRQKMVWFGEGNIKCWNRLVHMYDPDLLEHDREKATWAKVEDQSEQNITIEMSPFPSSDMVPEKK